MTGNPLTLNSVRGRVLLAGDVHEARILAGHIRLAIIGRGVAREEEAGLP